MNQILRCQTSRSHYGSKVPTVTITVFKYRNIFSNLQPSQAYELLDVSSLICIYLCFVFKISTEIKLFVERGSLDVRCSTSGPSGGTLVLFRSELDELYCLFTYFLKLYILHVSQTYKNILVYCYFSVLEVLGIAEVCLCFCERLCCRILLW